MLALYHILFPASIHNYIKIQLKTDNLSGGGLGNSNIFICAFNLLTVCIEILYKYSGFAVAEKKVPPPKGCGMPKNAIYYKKFALWRVRYEKNKDFNRIYR